MSSAAEATLVFPSVRWFQALQQLVNADPDFRRIGSIDVSMAVKVGPKIVVIIFEAFECLEVREGTEDDLVDLDFVLEMSEADWKDLIQNTKENGGADLRHTLNTLDLTKEDGLSNNATGDQFRADIFFRVNQSLQHFFDLSAKLDTTFET